MKIFFGLCTPSFKAWYSLTGVCIFFFPAVNGEQENRVQKGNGYFQVPPHTPVIFGEAGGRTLFRYRNSKVYTK